MQERFAKFVNGLLDTVVHDGVSESTLHAGIGNIEEAGEILGILKKVRYYGKPLDKALLLEEMGDQLHYFQMLCNEIGVTIDEVMAANMQKLMLRYPNGYSDNGAVNRDKAAEQRVFKDFWKDKSWQQAYGV
jgi:NTP pyrophosphatase (non-canonical NTP hydrolase)